MQRVVETACLLLLILVVGLRPLVQETYDSSPTSISRAIEAEGNASPARTLIFDLLILGSACGWLVARTGGSANGYRRSGLEIGATVIFVASIISCVYAGQKRLAVNASIDWLCYVVLAITLVQLMRADWQRRLLLRVILASATVQAAFCFDQYASLDATWNFYTNLKSEGLWEMQGVAADSPTVELYENRLRSAELSGTMSHSSVTGSYLVMCLLAALGILAARIKGDDLRRSARPTGGVIVGLLILGTALWLTKSRGAMAAGMVGLMIWAVVLAGRRWIDPNLSRAVLIGWALFLGGMAAVVGHGLYRGSLPGSSLAFRWQYWQGSAEMIRDHPIAGVGRENFGSRYTQYKRLEAAEEVANPHNLFVHAASEWGLPGLVGLAAMLVGGSITMTRRPRESESVPPAAGASASHATWGRETLAGAAIGMGIVLIRIPLLDSGLVEEPEYVFYTSFLTAASWAIGWLLFAPATNPSSRGLCAFGVSVGLLAFLFHDMINFALFTPPAATTFFALVAYVIAERSAASPSQDLASIRSRRLLAAGAVVATIVVGVLVALPAVRAQGALNTARAMVVRLPPIAIRQLPTYRAYAEAASVDRLDSTALLEQAEWLTRVSNEVGETEPLTLAIDALDEAQRRDPFSTRVYRNRLRVFGRRAVLTGTADDYLFAVEAARKLVELYPLSARNHRALGESLLAAGQNNSNRSLLAEAVASFEEAKRIDGQRPPWAQVRRLRDREVQEIDALIQRARQLLLTSQPD